MLLSYCFKVATMYIPVYVDIHFWAVFVDTQLWALSLRKNYEKLDKVMLGLNFQSNTILVFSLF